MLGQDLVGWRFVPWNEGLEKIIARNGDELTMYC